jgi:hypothetical protein
MRSGTNQYHGSAYDYFVNEIFNSGNPYLTGNPAGNPRPRARRNDYGFTVGGPVWIPRIYNGRDKTFFFFNWEQFRETTKINNQLQTVPTLAYRQGDFSAAILSGSPGSVRRQQNRSKPVRPRGEKDPGAIPTAERAHSQRTDE